MHALLMTATLFAWPAQAAPVQPLQDGKHEVKNVNELSLTILNNSTHLVVYPHGSRRLFLSVRPRINGDDSISFEVKLKVIREPLNAGDRAFMSERTVNHRVTRGASV